MLSEEVLFVDMFHVDCHWWLHNAYRSVGEVSDSYRLETAEPLRINNNDTSNNNNK